MVKKRRPDIFDPIHDILRSLGLVQSDYNCRNAHIWRSENRRVNLIQLYPEKMPTIDAISILVVRAISRKFKIITNLRSDAPFWRFLICPSASTWQRQNGFWKKTSSSCEILSDLLQGRATKKYRKKY